MNKFLDYIMTQRHNSPFVNNALVIQLALMSQSRTRLTTQIVSFPDWWATTVTIYFLLEGVHGPPVLEKRVPQYHNIKEIPVCVALLFLIGLLSLYSNFLTCEKHLHNEVKLTLYSL